MRFFETIFLALVIVSFLNSFFIKKKGLLLVLPLVALILAGASALLEGYRIHVIPAYIIAFILLLTGVYRTLLPEIKIHKAIRIISLFILIPAAIAAVTVPFLFPVVSLPKPTGAYAVGTQYMSFEDFERKECFSTTEEYRNVPVQVWYPASEVSGKKCATWINSSKAMDYFVEYRKLPNLLGHLSLVKTNSHLNASISAKEKKYPVIVFSGGAAMFYGQNVIQMEELASHGYIVFAVGHPYEDFADIYPDGRLVPYSQEQQIKLSMDIKQAVEIAKQSKINENSPEFTKLVLRNAKSNNESVKIWADDITFVINKIEELDKGKESGIFKGKLDIASIGVFGHSFGGAASGQACLKDSRIKAFANMDGGVFGDATDKCISQPFMILTTGGKEKSRITEGYSNQQKNYIMVAVAGAKHMNFSDLNSLIPVLGKLTGFLGNISETRQNEITNTYLLAFFDREIKGEDNNLSLLKQGASKKYHEVTVEIH